MNSHVIIREIGKFDVKVNVVPNGLEKYMAFTINKNLIFTDSMQFINSSLDALVKICRLTDVLLLADVFKSLLTRA